MYMNLNTENNLLIIYLKLINQQMKSRLQTTSIGLAFAAAVLLGASGCNDDWGQKDPEAGNQTYPTLQTVTTITFEDEEGGYSLPAGFAAKTFADDAIAEVVEDEIADSPVLSLNNAVASIPNPLNDVTCQAGVSFSFWMYQALEKDEDGNTVGSQDVRTPLIAFVNTKPSDAVEVDDTTESSESSSSSRSDSIESDAYEIYGTLSFTANGMIKYDADNGLFTDNDPDEFLTGYITPDEWHFVAVNIYDEGYAIYVDGMRKVDKYIPSFNCHKMVEFANNAQYVYINGTPDSESAPALLVDDITFARNNFTSKEVAQPKKGNIESSTGGADDGFNDPLYDGFFGPEDNVVSWWSIWSPSVNLSGNGLIHYEFTNYTIGDNNWENWVLILTSSGLTPNDDDYDGSDELIVLRADAYGWGTYYDASTRDSNYDWDTFTSEMDGAKVSIDIYHQGDVVTINSTTIGKSGAEYYWNVEFKGYSGDLLGAFFTVENAHLVFDVDETFVGRYYKSGTYTLGNEDFSNTFWSCWTPQERFDTKFRNFGFEFINHSAGEGTWQYWNLVVTNGYQSGEDDANYAEYLYLRDDAYGWADRYSSGTMTSSFNWDTFLADMQGAKSRIMFRSDGDDFLMVARQWKADGTELPIYKFEVDGIALPLSLIFTCEGSWLDFLRIGYYPWCELTTK